MNRIRAAANIWTSKLCFKSDLAWRSVFAYLISLSSSVKNLRDLVYLEVHCQEDLQMWHRFLKNWNGISLFYDTHFTVSSDMHLFNDSSLIGLGGIFRNQWFCSKWSSHLPSFKEGDLSVAFCELYPIVAAAIIWGGGGGSWTSKRVLLPPDNLATVYIIQRGLKCSETCSRDEQKTQTSNNQRHLVSEVFFTSTWI